MNKTINEIEAAFLYNLMEKDWLDDTTRDHCMDKVHALLQCLVIGVCCIREFGSWQDSFAQVLVSIKIPLNLLLFHKS